MTIIEPAHERWFEYSKRPKLLNAAKEYLDDFY